MKFTSLCLAWLSLSLVSGEDDGVNVIKLAGIYDTTVYDWSPDIFNVTVSLINKGWWGALPNTNGFRVEYQLENSNCDETTAARAWWKMRTANGDKPLDGIVGPRCSGASVSLARISGLEHVPHLSPTSNSAQLSNDEEFPYFSRLVAANDERGEVGATVALLRSLGWSKVTVLSTDTVFSKDWANSFRKTWVGGHGDWTGSVAYSDTFRLRPDGGVDAESIRQTLQGIPTDGSNSRVILLPIHSQHAAKILEEAAKINFQPDTIWVGGSSWVPRLDRQNWGKGSIPGYIGIAPFQNRDGRYVEFLGELQAWQKANGQVVSKELPAFARETVDAIRAMTEALSYAKDKRDGQAVVRDLRNLKFDGVSGPVEFSDIGDRKDPLYSIYNAPSVSDNGTVAWHEVGYTGTEIGSVVYHGGRISEKWIHDICFADVGCGVPPPSDSYPQPPLPVPAWTIVLLVVVSVVCIFVAYRYRRSKEKKIAAKRELTALQQSIAGMRTAKANYIPRVAKSIIIDIEEQPLLAKKKRSGSIVVEGAKWIWQESPGCIGQHEISRLYGDPKDLWVRYDEKCTKKLENAFKRNKTKVSLLDGYEVDFGTMMQTKLKTKFQRKVQRVVDRDSSTEIDISDEDIGDWLPADLEGEAQMVLVEGDVVQISKSRPHDDWSFGTKLHAVEEATARQLVEVACDGMDPDKANVFHDSGWFQLGKTRIPTAEDLKFIKEQVGEDALAQPSSWTDVVDPSVAEKRPLASGPERKAVEDAFLHTLDRSRYQVLKIERVQNLAMWQSYVVKRQTICHREAKRGGSLDGKAQVDRFERKWLFHGTNFEVLDKILQQGFNRSFCGKNATRYGKGVYFAKESSYSACTTYSTPDSKGFQYVMACRVTVGEYCVGQEDALTPSVRDASNHLLYDATVNCAKDPTVFVTYHDAQAYPEYIITFKSITSTSV